MLWEHYELETALIYEDKKGDGWEVSGVSIDTRTLRPGDLFVALKGPSFDGHDFIAQAYEKGAAGVLSEKEIAGNGFVVEDTYQALCQLARYSQQRFKGVRIAITGSVGKTTFKELLSFLIGKQKTVYATEGNLNNHIGVPLSLARLPRDYDVGVFELGMNHAGEIRELTRLVVPDIAVVTAIAPAHIEFFEDTEEIANAKAEIFECVDRGGTAFINNDTLHATLLGNKAASSGVQNTITYGVSGSMSLVSFEGKHAHFRLGLKELDVTLPMPGKHWAINVLGVFAILRFLGLNLQQSVEDLKSFLPTKGRGAMQDVSINEKNVTLIDDSYNANPTSMEAALETLSNIKAGRKIAILGEMLELGDDAGKYHLGLKNSIESSGASLVMALGENMSMLHDALPANLQGGAFNDCESLSSTLETILQDGDLLLFKGSHGSDLWHVVKKFS